MGFLIEYLAAANAPSCFEGLTCDVSRKRVHVICSTLKHRTVPLRKLLAPVVQKRVIF